MHACLRTSVSCIRRFFATDLHVHHTQSVDIVDRHIFKAAAYSLLERERTLTILRGRILATLGEHIVFKAHSRRTIVRLDTRIRPSKLDATRYKRLRCRQYATVQLACFKTCIRGRQWSPCMYQYDKRRIDYNKLYVLRGRKK